MGNTKINSRVASGRPQDTEFCDIDDLTGMNYIIPSEAVTYLDIRRRTELIRLADEAKSETESVEGNVRFGKIMEEGAGIILTGSAIVFGALAAVVIAPTGAILTGALTVSFPLIAGSILGALQLGSGFTRIYLLTTKDDELYEMIDNNKTLKIIYFIIDFLAVVISIVGVMPAFKNVWGGIGPRLNQFKDFLKNSKPDRWKIQKISRDIEYLKNDYNKALIAYRNAEYPILNGVPNGKEVLSASMNGTMETLKKLIIEFEKEAKKFDKLNEYKILIDHIQMNILLPFLKLLQSKNPKEIILAFKSAFVEKREEINELISMISLFANITPGHGIATGSLNDITEITPKLQDKDYQDSKLRDYYNELKADLKTMNDTLPPTTQNPIYPKL